MEVTKENILSKTHYGLKVYAYVLRQFYPNSTVLSLKGRDCKLTQNPFNGGKSTLQINIIDNKAVHYDTELKDFKGDAFEFASYHFKMIYEEQLLLKLNDVLHLNLNTEKEEEDSWFDVEDDTWYTHCSFYKAPIRNVFPSDKVRLHQIFERITSDKYKSITEQFRAIQAPKEARKFKANHFDYATFSGVFSKRNEESLIEHSSLLTIDFDHLENLEKLKDQLINDEYFETELLFTSPSGNGLKWIIKIDISDVTHQEYFIAVSNYIKQTYNIEVDQSGKDISRACFLSYDPLAYLNKRHQKT